MQGDDQLRQFLNTSNYYLSQTHLSILTCNKHHHQRSYLDKNVKLFLTTASSFRKDKTLPHNSAHLKRAVETYRVYFIRGKMLYGFRSSAWNKNHLQQISNGMEGQLGGSRLLQVSNKVSTLLRLLQSREHHLSTRNVLHRTHARRRGFSR